MSIIKKEERRMTKKKRCIYEVELYTVNGWDEENDRPDDLYPIVDINGKDYSYACARVMDVYRFYENNLEELKEANQWDGLSYDLMAREIEVSDEEWYKLLKKEQLAYHDYEPYLTKSAIPLVVSECYFDGHSYSWNDIWEYILIDQSENFNMRIVCEKAGISYSTFRGFKYNNKSLSFSNGYQLLRTMKEIGDDCWTQCFDEDIQIVNKFSKKYDIE